MINNEFDNMIKESLEGLSVAPSAKVGKTLGRKMLFKNIWIFHKKKALMLLLILGVSGFTYYTSYIDENFNTSTKQFEATKSTLEIEEIDKSNESSSPTLIQEKNNLVTATQKGTEAYTKDLVNKLEETTVEAKENSNRKNRKNKAINKPKSSKRKSTISTDDDYTVNSSEKLNNSSQEFSPFVKTKELNNFRVENKDALSIENKLDNKIIPYSYTPIDNNDYVEQKKGVISIDAFYTPYNQTNITNEIDSKYMKNWWDFYKESGYVNSKLEIGLNLNYNWKNIVASSGLELNKIVEYKPAFIYKSMDDADLLNNYGLSEISGVKVTEFDSAHYVFYTKNDPELIDKIENEHYNTYSYLSIPVKLGYEFQAPKFSVLVQAGLSYNRLIGANGTYLRKYTNSETIDIYYNKGIETALLTRKNAMLKSSTISFIASAAGNIKVTPSFDLFGEFTFQKSRGNITKTDYIVQKKVTNFGTNFGVKYYLKPRSKASTPIQDVF